MPLLAKLRCLLTMGRGVVRGLPVAAAGSDPIELYNRWFDAARDAGLLLPEAACLATATPDGQPSARMVLLKGVSGGGFVFFTNYHSRKAVELDANPRVALCIHWPILQRQIRIEGTASRVTQDESDVYFASRPRGSRIGAWASKQSQTLPALADLEARVSRFNTQFPGDAIPRPDFWGGYRVRPTTIEFWQGKANRLHDRLVFERDGDGWVTRWLYP